MTDEAESKHKVFVYGTLRPSHKGKEPSEIVTVKGRLYNLGWFPGIELGGNDEVICETIYVDDDGLAKLDDYEGYSPSSPSSLYIRTSIMINGETGWIYVYNRSVTGKEVILSGDWMKKETVDVP